MTQAASSAVILPSQRALEAILREMVERFGGVYGVRDLAAIVAALSRVDAMRAKGGDVSVVGAAAAIGYSLAQNPMPTIVARNPRAAWFAMFVTLRLNGRYLDAREGDATAIVRGLTDGSVDESALIMFLEANSREVSR